MDKEQIKNLVREILAEEFGRVELSDRILFKKHIQMQNGAKIILGTGTGTMIGTETTQKVGFLGKAPIARQSAITAPVGGGTVDGEARGIINDIITLLENFGFIAPN